MRNRTKLPALYLILITVFTYIPIIVTVVYSFHKSKIFSVWDGFSLKWYYELWNDRSIKEALFNSLKVAFLSCSMSAIIGTLGALGMHKSKRKFKKLNSVIEYVAMLPIMIPEIILGMVFLATFSFLNLPFGILTLVIAHTSFCIPYIFMLVKARLIGMDPSIEEAAKDLGASPIRIFFDITLPLILPAILSGAILSFAMSFDDVVISIFVTGAKTNTLPIKIYTKLKTGVTPEINALATVLLVLTTLAILLSNRIKKVKM